MKPKSAIEMKYYCVQWMDSSVGRALSSVTRLAPGQALVRVQACVVDFFVVMNNKLDMEVLTLDNLRKHPMDLMSEAVDV